MSDVIFTRDESGAGPEPSPLYLVARQDWPALAETLPSRARATAALANFLGKAGELVVAPDAAGAVGLALLGVGDGGVEPSLLRGAAARLPAGDYDLRPPDRLALDGVAAEAVLVAWAQGAYRFDRYRRDGGDRRPARLIAPPGADLARARALASACALTRDMVNTPANDMGPDRIEAVAREVAAARGGAVTVSVGDDLLSDGYPAVHAVGRAATPARAPRMIEITWGQEGRPSVVVIGKGVAFDSGGLDIKPSAAMRNMKKDMGGAAHALGLAAMIMDLALPVRLTVLIPAVENAISGDAMRPGDILASRSGLSIEVGNTDAEGRLILADALTRAGELEPDLTIDLATLTGAARAALGPQVIPFYTPDEVLAAGLAAASAKVDDPLWRMPLWAPYAAALDSDVADIKNDPDGWAQAGSVTAALFLQRFAPTGAWAHFDIFAWNPRSRPGWPSGAEAQAIRAILALIEDRYR